MGRKNKNRGGVLNGTWDYLIWGLLIGTGYLLYHTNVLRAQVGYFEDGPLIFWNSLAYVVFFGLVTGYIISKLIKKTG
jgi:D-alanyl-lipoteichoic acid acyltransferase DltB (MBOAT superfamily)